MKEGRCNKMQDVRKMMRKYIGTEVCGLVTILNIGAIYLSYAAGNLEHLGVFYLTAVLFGFGTLLNYYYERKRRSLSKI